jgi:hypothetical protein
MPRDAEIDTACHAFPSPQRVKDRPGGGWNVVSGFSSSVNQWDIDRKRDVGGGVKLLVDMKKAGNRSF